MTDVTLLVGGDVAPIGRNLSLFERGDAEGLARDLLPELRAADLTVVNLEAPLIRAPNPIRKVGAIFGAPVGSARGLPALGIKACNLANNHIRDHGTDGVHTTLEMLKEIGVVSFGAGLSLATASQVRVIQVKGLRVGLLGAADHEFCVATDTDAGANPIDPMSFWELTREPVWDVLVVLLHAGPDSYPYPTPRLQRLCRHVVALGAHVVVCQHSHVAGCVERFADSLIVYGQGNLLFDVGSSDPSWREGFLVRLRFQASRLRDFELLPYRESESIPGIRSMKPGEAESFLARVAERSARSQDPGELRREWKQYCRRRSNSYAEFLRGNRFYHRWARRISDRLGWTWPLTPRRCRLAWANLIRCADHREALETLLTDETSCCDR